MKNILPKNKQIVFTEAYLYQSFSLEGYSVDDLIQFFYGGGTVDAWCNKCHQHSLFHIKSQMPAYGEQEKKLPHSGHIVIEAVCGRGGVQSYNGCDSILTIVFAKNENEIVKIGQNPSMAELEYDSQDKAIVKELTNTQREELGKAVGLFAHGIGIGSFVYLRRIFENLVEEAHKNAKNDPDWKEDDYFRSRMSEKLVFLAKYLPKRLVENSSLYSILSLGIHELTEKECLENFILVKGAIELILKQKNDDKEYEQMIADIHKIKSSK